MLTILLATFNGSLFLSEQLDSLLAQTVRPSKIVILDDCSTDQTWQIITDYIHRYPAIIVARRNKANSGSAKCTFLQLMLEVRDDYLMLCDQDDVWLPEKIEKSLSRMKVLERIHMSDTPLLVYTDLHVVDSSLNEIAPSFEKYMDADFTRTELQNLLIQNTLTGCTAIYNRGLADLLTQEPAFCVLHDWWLILVAAAFGKIAYLPEQTILYRQHSRNEIGAKNVHSLRYKLDRLINNKQVKAAIRRTYPQALSLLDLYRDKLAPEQIRLLSNYSAIPNLSKLAKWHRIFKLKTMKHGFARNVAYLLFI